ncbi:uncharacterized protein [Montipora capricornis]|uniref:uncharacterized protein n=1 Tax=Montipora capricornis TaxID=246305 RepID=UPI0035F19406
MLSFVILLTLCGSPFSLGSTNVYRLNEQDFEGYIRDKDVMLVDFFAPWCPHCQQLNPELDAAADLLATKHQYVFGKVDCENDGKELCRRFKIEGYPTMKLFKYGQYVGDYVGQRDRGSLMQYVDSVASTVSQNTPLTTEATRPATLNQASSYKPHLPMIASHHATSFHSPALANTNAKHPSLMASFYGSSAHAQTPPHVAAFLGNAPPVQQASPDSLQSKFGSLASLDIYRSKLKMIAAYKNYQRRLDEYRRKLLAVNKARVGPVPQNFAGAVTQPPRPGTNAFAQPQTYRGYYRPEAIAAQNVQINRAYPQAPYIQYANPYGYPMPAASPYYRSKTGDGGKRHHDKHRRPAHRPARVRNSAYNKQPVKARVNYQAAQYYKQQQQQQLKQQQLLQQQQQMFNQQTQRQQRQQQQLREQQYRQQEQQQHQQQQQQQQLQSSQQQQPQKERQQQLNQQAHHQQPQQFHQGTLAKPVQQVYVAPKISQPKKNPSPSSPKKPSNRVTPTDTAALKDLKADIESAIQDALKSAVATESDKTKPTPTVVPSVEVAGERAKTDQSGSGSAAQSLSSPVRSSGTQDAVHGEGSGSGDKPNFVSESQLFRVSQIFAMFSIIALIALAVVGPSLCAPSDPVFKLTDADFDHFLKDKDAMLVDFYAPWCSDCARLKPEFDSAARDLAQRGKYVFAKINCFGEGKGTCENRFNVHSWPQIKVFRRGRYAGEYQGPQDKASIERFMDLLLKQKVPDNVFQDQPSPCKNVPPYMQNPAGPWYQNGWTYTKMGTEPYQNPTYPC